MTPQRRTALVSIIAACLLIAVKLLAGIATNSLGLLSEAAHSGTDLVAAILTFVALGVAGRPADPGHAYGHGKAEHLAALGEAAILVVASLVIAWRALWRLFGLASGQVDPRGWALLVIGAVMIIDAGRAYIHYDQACNARPQAAEPRYYMGLMHQSHGAHELAQRCFTEALRVEPTLSRISSSISTLSRSERMAMQARRWLELASTSSEMIVKTWSDQPSSTV